VFTDATVQLPVLFDNTAGAVFGDVDGDGDLDAFVANGGPETLLLNDGFGSFTDASALLPPANDPSTCVALGDVDGDGDLDALVGSAGCTSFGTPPVFVPRLLLNDGTGAFSDASGQIPSLLYSFDTGAVAFGDLDGDGDLDLVVGNFRSGGPLGCGEAQNYIYWNDGAGSFASQVFDFSGWYTRNVTLEDEDGDGDLDVFFGNASSCSLYGESNCGYGSYVRYRNDGGGAFAGPFTIAGITGLGASMDVGDVDGDGDVDLLAGRLGGHVRLYLNDGASGFSDVSGAGAIAAATEIAAALGDFDGDGNLDALTTSTDYYGPVRLYRSDGIGLFSNSLPEPVATSVFPVFSISAGDLDGDGDLDAVLGSGWGFPADNKVLLNDGGGSFATLSNIIPPPDSAVGDLTFGDVDGDGDLDLFVGISSSSDRLYLNDGMGLFTHASGNLPPSADITQAVVLADLDGDGDLDAVTGNSGNNGEQSRLYLNDGSGIFTDATSQLPPGLWQTWDVVAGDVDGDGDTDLFLGNAGQQDRLYLNDGAGVFSDATSQLPAAVTTPWIVALGDADGDGDLDAFFGDYQSPHRLYLNDGMGNFVDASASLPLGGLSVPAASWGDVDGDGDPDLVLLDGPLWAGRLRVLANLTRQLTRRAVPRIGKPMTLDLYGPAWGAWFLAASPGTGFVPIPPFGALRLDPTNLIFIHASLLDGQGRAAPTFPVPADAALVGATLYWQAVLASPARLTNLEATPFSAL